CGELVETTIQVVWGCQFAITIEARAIYKGLTLAWKKGFCKVVTESDNALLIDIIVSDYASNNNLSELCLIHDICNQDWQLKFRHVLREHNNLANYMAKVVPSYLNM
ncbi:hypothetical protein Goari_024133, partial [Gossypium aridum]|nr:hypothetical protein [Gossypium aridum]